MKLFLIRLLFCFSLILFFACENSQPLESTADSPKSTELQTLVKKGAPSSGGLEKAEPGLFIGEVNEKLAAANANVRILYSEWITDLNSEKVGRTVYFKNVGNKKLTAHWVPGDPNRDGRTNITWLVDQVDGTPTGVTVEDANLAIDRAMTTWQNAATSSLPLEQIPDSGMDWGYVQNILEMGGIGGWLADITHAGWLPRAYFDAIAPPDGGDYILGVTHTLIWTENGIPTDMDNNGKMDVAFREIYYNNNFSWGIDSNYPDMDVESIVLHETGHGLSQAHFGTLFRSGNGKLHFSPQSVMNAGFIGIPGQELTGTDLAGHSSIWASWPNR
ncbi:MAG: hypothetical protein E4H13_14415 [Calditrichales bacterium]|nr:MAG: hypothetical protein E4H13_14415 [Calditrichales bacterium]